MAKPVIRTMIDARIVESTQAYLDFFDSEDYCEDRINDYENDIVEAVMQVLYGDDVYEWISSRM